MTDQNHIGIDKIPAKLICTNCSYEAENINELNAHITSSHLEGINCPEGDCTFIAKEHNELTETISM